MQALSLRGLKKTYRNGVEALVGIDLDVAEGDFFALLGPNGAGKSTAIGTVCSLVRKTAGTITVFGHDLDRNAAAAKACIGLVPQELNFNVYEPIEEILVNQAGYYGIPRREGFRRAEMRLHQLGLLDRRRDMGRELSGGMKRRLMIARALVHDPKLLILDEPTAGVDIEIRRSLWDLIREVNAQGTTIILTTHYLEEAESLCRNIAIINHGRIVENTTVAELLYRLHKETFVLNLKRPLRAIPKLADYHLRPIDGHTIEVEITKDQDLNALFTSLSHQGIEVGSLRNKQNRLERVFMDLLDGPAA